MSLADKTTFFDLETRWELDKVYTLQFVPFLLFLFLFFALRPIYYIRPSFS